jgi:hypothetical protein
MFSLIGSMGKTIDDHMKECDFGLQNAHEAEKTTKYVL